MSILVTKLGASGDVVRTTVLLHKLKGEIFWLTSDSNITLLKDLAHIIPVSWSNRHALHGKQFDLVINLEDSEEVAYELNKVKYAELYGSYINSAGGMTYTDNSKDWFDLSLISRFGKKEADRLKLQNRKSFQELLFQGLGYTFQGEPYYLPKHQDSDLAGDIAIAQNAGTVWPMKNWAFYNDLANVLTQSDYHVNFLPQRSTMLEHLADVRNHKYLISGDSLPMHFALGSGIKCLTIFTCTSPWEIYDYGIQRKVVSPKLDKFFYRRDYVPEASTSIPLKEVHDHFMELSKS
jgi:ADP-heptose:LPS heptosyltransferase